MIQGGTSTQAKSRQGRKIKMGMIGGSLEAFIGAVHRRGAQLDGEIELVCGAFSSSAQKSKETGEVNDKVVDLIVASLVEGIYYLLECLYSY